MTRDETRLRARTRRGFGSDATRPRAGPGRPWLVLLAIVPGIVLTLADATIMSVAVPLVIQRLDASVTAVSWIMNGYNLVLTVLFLPMGRLGDRWGHKRVFVLGLALFTAASLGCARTETIEALIAWRAVQAVGAAGVIPTALTIVLAAYPAARRGFAAGMFGALSSAAAALGPTLGGVLIDRWSWQAVFWFNLPVGLLGIALALALHPAAAGRSRRRRVSTCPAPPSPPPASSASPSASSRATRGAGRRRASSCCSSPPPLLLAGFFVHEARTREPFLDLVVLQAALVRRRRAPRS